MRAAHPALTSLLTILLFASSNAFAQDVILEVIGPPSEARAFTDSLTTWPQFESIKWVDTSPNPSARVRATWNDTACTLQIFRGADQLIREKSIPRSDGSLVVTESAALLAHSALEEILRPEPVIEAPPIIEAVTPIEPMTVREAFSRVTVGAHFQARTYDADLPVLFGGGAHASITFLGGFFRPSLTLLASYQGPVTQRGVTVPLTVQLQTFGLRLMPGLEHRFAPLSIGLQAGGGLDVLFADVTPGQNLPMERVTPSRVDPAPFISAALVARWDVTSSIDISLRVLLDVDPAPRRYSALGEKLLEPWAVRPGLQLGVGFDFFVGTR